MGPSSFVAKYFCIVKSQPCGAWEPQETQFSGLYLNLIKYLILTILAPDYERRISPSEDALICDYFHVSGWALIPSCPGV